MSGQTSYRGSAGPVQPYAFTATPTLANNNNNIGPWQNYGAFRTNSSPGSVPTVQTIDARPRYQSNPSGSATQSASRDDSSLPNPSRMNSRQPSPHVAGGPGQPTFAQVAAAKASPDRYRRPVARHADSTPVVQQQHAPQTQGSAMPSGSGMANVVHLYNPRVTGSGRVSRTTASRPQSAYGSLMTGVAVDDMHVHRHTSEEEHKRFRRRSMASFDTADYPNPMTPQEFKQQQQRAEELAALKRAKAAAEKQQKPQKPVTRILPVPTVEKNHAPLHGTTTHARNGSSESLASSRSSNSRPSSSTNRNSNASAPTTSSPASTIASDEKSNAADHGKSVTIPPRGSSSDVGKRVLNPSPLSKPSTMASGAAPNDPASAAAAAASSPAKLPGSSQGTRNESAAAKQLAAIGEKGGKPKSKTSRLRRAFSFGSAAELKKASMEQEAKSSQTPQNDASKLNKDSGTEDLYEAEQERIAQKQEASGLGNSIYSGTKIFTGSTDNLSISSTASSASIMLRKMGKGMKKGSRSLVGLFRPKSVIGSPTGDLSAPEASQATVSMITVEAERERVNVNSNGDLDQSAGGTGFPRLERNSIDATHLDAADSSDRAGSAGADSMRKSIVGGDRERAEVLATMRKGILKTRSDSPSPGPAQDSKPNFELPMIPNVSDSPSSSAPSTPNDDASHRRSGSVAIGGEDYFLSALRLRQDSKSAPGTPQGGIGKRNATFSPRIVFHDTWPSQEYDRRGEIATCNRLTPMLAQQIKEELNSFKMEMEVHETSKIYTHFF